MKMIDLHCDTVLGMEQGQGLYRNDCHVDIQKLQKSNSLAQFFALFINSGEAEKAGVDPWDRFLKLYEIFQTQMEENSAHIALTRNAREMAINEQDHKISAFLTIEEGGVLDGKIDRLQQACDMGVRLITLTWNYPNCLGYPNGMNSMEHRACGLTAFGREVVEAMNHLGMIVDVSHLSDAGFDEVATISQKPFIASHSNARALCGHGRNLTDEMLNKLGNCGGVAGLNFCPAFLNEEKICTPEILAAHARHMVNCAGIEAVALGTDFDGIGGDLRIPDIGEMHLLWEALSKKGFSEREIEKIWFANAKRIIEEVL